MEWMIDARTPEFRKAGVFYDVYLNGERLPRNRVVAARPDAVLMYNAPDGWGRYERDADGAWKTHVRHGEVRVEKRCPNV